MIKFEQVKGKVTFYRAVRDSAMLVYGRLYVYSDGESSLLCGVDYSRGKGYDIIDLWTGLGIQKFAGSKKAMEDYMASTTFSTYEDPETPVGVIDWLRSVRRQPSGAWYDKAHAKILKISHERSCVHPDILHYLEAETWEDAVSPWMADDILKGRY